MFIVFAKLGTALALIVVLLVVLSQRRWLETRLGRSAVPWLGIFWFVLRLLPFVIIYVVLDYEPQSDVKGYYFPIGTGAAAGEMMYRDVHSPYAPFFGYYLSLPLILWNDARVIVLTMTGVELVAVWLTYRDENRGESRGQRLFRCLFYYLLPVPFVFCVMSGQEDVGLWIFTLLAGQALVSTKSYSAGLWFGLGLLSTKVIFVLLFVPLFFMAKNKIRFLAGCATLGLPVLLFLLWKTGTLFMTQPMEEGTFLKAPNLRSVLAPFIGEAINRTVRFESYLGLLITVLTTIVVLQTKRLADPRRSVALLYILMFSLTTVLQHNAISTYAYLFMLPLVFVMLDFRDRWACVALLVFNVMAAVHPSFWWRLGEPFFYSFDQLNWSTYWVDYAMEVFLVSGFAYIAFRAARLLRAGVV